MNIIHVIAGMQKAAGTTTFVENVTRGLVSNGLKVKIVMSTEGLEYCDVMHIHGLWSGLLHKSAKYAKGNGIPIVWSTHGMTAPWSMRHKWWKKIPAWWIYQKRDLKMAKIIHCTTQLEAGWNNALGFNNCFVAPLGTNRINSSWSKNQTAHTLLFVGRIYPVKGLANLIQAWKLCGDVRDWRLRIVGPDQDGHRAELERLIAELGLGGSVHFAGPKFGWELSEEYESCDCLVLPSFTENFGATIVDALAHGKPCIASTFTPWSDLVEWGCGWWVENDPSKLSRTICELIATSDDELRRMGERGRKLVEEKYTWNVVVQKMIEVYEEILNDRP